MTDRELIDLRAEVAMRDEDYRIAKKHREEAAERIGTDENVRAYKRAERWARDCYDRACEARGRLIRANIA